MDLPSAMQLAFQFLESKYQVSWTAGKGNREAMLAAYSQTDVPKAEFLGYKSSDGIRHAWWRAVQNCDKPKSMLWENWLLSNIGKFFCSSCKEVLDISESIAGKSYSCKSCDARRKRVKNKELREKGTLTPQKTLVLSYLQKGCTDCGMKNIICLEFDHLVPSEKSFNISEGYAKPINELQAELDKCEVVCANCHRIRTAITYNHYKLYL